MKYPNQILHWIKDKEIPSFDGGSFPKYNPANGKILGQVTRGTKRDAKIAVDIADESFNNWSNVSIIHRSEILRQVALLLVEHKEDAAEIIAIESGKPKKNALNEVDAAIECGLFMAGEGRRYSGETLTSAVPNRSVQLIRQSIGAGALIVPFNNPMASIANKLFPALLCGNSIILKSHEDTPYVAIWFAKILKQAGLPSGVFSVLQGFGQEVGVPLIEDARVKFISFTGSVATGAFIIKASANRLAKVSIEAGGKNPLVVCDDADLEKAVSTAISSAFVDAGQRCAATSRLIIFDVIYEEFKKKLLKQIRTLKIGVNDNDDFGAIISEKRLNQILEAVNKTVSRGATVLFGGERLNDKAHQGGYFLTPTVLENVSPDDEISQTELFGPVVILYHAKDFNEALELANNSKFKLSGAIHTKNIHRIQEFIKRYQAGVVRVNGPTHGSEPHMPFGGLGLSGNGWREPGNKALDFYSEWKQVSIDYDSSQI